MVDTHHQCCKDERHFVEFYQDLSEELAKRERAEASHTVVEFVSLSLSLCVSVCVCVWRWPYCTS